MDAFDNSAVMRWLTMMIVTMLLLIALAPAQPIRSQESPLPTEWIPSPDICGGMIPNMLPAECHSDHRDYYVFFPTIMRGAPCVCYMPLRGANDYGGGWLTVRVDGAIIRIQEYSPGG